MREDVCLLIPYREAHSYCLLGSRIWHEKNQVLMSSNIFRIKILASSAKILL